MLEETKIKSKIEVEEFLQLIRKYAARQFECTEHTFFRLSKEQKELFTCEELTKIILKERPFLVGMQHNKNRAIFYNSKSKENKVLKIVISIKSQKVNIVTFYYIQDWQVPKI